MAKINLNNVDVDEVTVPHSGNVGLLESRKPIKSLFDSAKWENPKLRTHASKPKTRMVTRAMNTRLLAVEAEMSRMEGNI